MCGFLKSFDCGIIISFISLILLFTNRPYKRVKRIASLTELRLNDNRIRNIDALAGHSTITFLDLRRNNIENIDALQGLSFLETLYIDVNRITDISSLAGCTSLENLTLQRNYITDITVLLELPSLKSVRLGRRGSLIDANPLDRDGEEVIKTLREQGVTVIE